MFSAGLSVVYAANNFPSRWPVFLFPLWSLYGEKLNFNVIEFMNILSYGWCFLFCWKKTVLFWDHKDILLYFFKFYLSYLRFSSIWDWYHLWLGKGSYFIFSMWMCNLLLIEKLSLSLGICNIICKISTYLWFASPYFSIGPFDHPCVNATLSQLLYLCKSWYLVEQVPSLYYYCYFFASSFYSWAVAIVG